MLSVTAHRTVAATPDIASHCIQIHSALHDENRMRYTAQSILTCFQSYHLPSVREARDIVQWSMGDAYRE